MRFSLNSVNATRYNYTSVCVAAAARIFSVPEIYKTCPVTWALFCFLISVTQGHRTIQVGRDFRRSSSPTCHSECRVKIHFRPGCSTWFQQNSSWDVWV